MKIETKYNVGEKVKVYVDEKVICDCPFCNGEGYKIINDDKLYCQNCDNGKMSFRRNNRILAEGTITGFRYTVNTNGVDEYDDIEDYAKVDGNETHEIEYFVEVDENKYYGNGTYNENKIFS